MSSQSDHEAFLRAELQAAAESLEPNPDGLERITARLQRRRAAPIAAALAVWNELVPRAPAWLQDTLYRIGALIRPVWDRIGPAQAQGWHRSRTEAWLRPVAAMAVMFIVAAGIYVAIDASVDIFPSSANSRSSDAGTQQGGHSGGPAPGSSQSGAPSVSGSGSANPARSASCPPGTPMPKGSATPAPSASASPSPTATPTATPSPSPIPSATASPSPSVGSSVGAAAVAQSAKMATVHLATSPTITASPAPHC
ncbi:MAG: hypothetical protein J2P28_03595 [Actinobacteria bacterium]|nr:hypothetical protein [Actinomycetota bacterium]MBO0834590.1 hypothetical protein [Actinomycetota bacterium]